jgi:protein-L-isoaspartate(D-aspartate) O-methyltransferase
MGAMLVSEACHSHRARNMCMQNLAHICLLIALLSGGQVLAGTADNFARQRAQLMEEIQRDARDASDYLGRRRLDARVIEAMQKVPRHEFVPRDEWRFAYENRPLPIGYGQTISQPYVVALMTDLLRLKPDDRVLEIGTGSGYQAAILAELTAHVYSIEIIRQLAENARTLLDRLGYQRVQTRIGDGYYGWAEQAPFDAIIVTAASDHVPPPLIRQLKPGGRMLIPVGSRFMTQQLVLVEKASDGTVTTRLLLPVRFVPLTREH